MVQPGDDLYPRFSPGEFQRRYRLVDTLLDEEGLDALVVFGWSAMGRAMQGDVHYLSGYLGMRDNYVIYAPSQPPVLFAQSYNHVPNAALVSVLEDVRWGGPDTGETLGRELRRRGATEVGVVGWMPYQHHESMRSAAEGCRFRDLTSRFRRLRVAKSGEELAWLGEGARFTDAALAGLTEGLVPGVREYELAEPIERAYLREGGLTGFYYLASTPMAKPDRCVPAQVLSHREIRAGDLVTTEISIGYGGYAGQGLRTFTVEADPTPLIAELHEVASSVFESVAAAIRPGASHEEVWDAAAAIAGHGFTIRDGLVHGFGIGLLPPSIRTRETSHGDETWIFEEGQTLVIQPNVITPDESVGVQTGELCVVTPDGAQSLHRFPRGLLRTP